MSSSVLGSLRRAREWAYPTLTSSAFLEKGVLTPEEFVQAGDELVFRCPTWSWESGEPTKRKSYLPADKQYLITRNVPCQNRVSSMETNMIMEGGDDGDDDWLISSILKQEDDGVDNIEDEFDILDEDGEIVDMKMNKETLTGEEVAGGGKAPAAAAATGAAEVTTTTPSATTTAATTQQQEEQVAHDDEYADMADFEDDNVLMDDDAAVVASTTASNTPAGKNSDSNNLVKVRTYDISITYDKYYQTPRVWMLGRNEYNQQPLTARQMMEDVISDYANKTVTMEKHPHLSGPHASIHPCQHGKVMKAIVKNLIKASQEKATREAATQEGDETAQEQGPSVEMYLFIFLKFVSSMIPTISYDYTMDVTADTTT